ncbi:MAG TPA: hypothetical protein VI958_05110 [Acidobacteriota bacterium]
MINTIEEAIGKLRYIQLDSDFTPQQILHMVLAGGASQTLLNLHTQAYQSAVEFLCTATASMPDYSIRGGLIKEDEAGPFFVGERPNEFLGTLAAAGIHFDTVGIVTDKGNSGTLSDLVKVAMRKTIAPEHEPGWSLMLFSVYPGATKEWTDDRGEMQSVEKILKNACNRRFGSGVCFGSHLLEGIAFAVSRYCMEQDVEPAQLDGVWRRGFDYSQTAMRLIRRNLLEDGSINRCWFKEKSYPRTGQEWKEKWKDLTSRHFRPAYAIIKPTGHLLDAISPLSMFLGSDKDWIYSALYVTAQTIENHWIEIASNVSALAHAIHALKVLGE